MKYNQLTPLFIETVPETLEDGILYISDKYKTSLHNCCCGCGQKTVLPFYDPKTDWTINITEDKKVSFHPSIGNWSFNCRSHYLIKNNQIIWV